MPYADKDKQKAYKKDNFLPRVNITMLRNEENVKLYELFNEAAKDNNLSLSKYAILAIKEKLERDGYI